MSIADVKMNNEKKEMRHVKQDCEIIDKKIVCWI